MNQSVTTGEEHSDQPKDPNRVHTLPPRPPGLTNQRPAPGVLSYAHSVTKNLFRTNSDSSQLSAKDVWFKSINPGAVVFDFSPVSATFPNNSPMEAIVRQYGEDNIRGFKKLSGKNSAAYEVLFSPTKAASLRKLATEAGIAFHGKTIKAQATIEMSAQLTKVKLRNLPLYPSFRPH